MRKALGVTKQLYSKYDSIQEFVEEFSQIFYDEIVSD